MQTTSKHPAETFNKSVNIAARHHPVSACLINKQTLSFSLLKPPSLRVWLPGPCSSPQIGLRAPEGRWALPHSHGSTNIVADSVHHKRLGMLPGISSGCVWCPFLSGACPKHPERALVQITEATSLLTAGPAAPCSQRAVQLQAGSAW